MIKKTGATFFTLIAEMSQTNNGWVRACLTLVYKKKTSQWHAKHFGSCISHYFATALPIELIVIENIKQCITNILIKWYFDWFNHKIMNNLVDTEAQKNCAHV